MYHNYAKYFDKIFPAKKGTIDFLDTYLRGETVLDIGCGSGGYAIALHQKGYTLKGIDLDEEMIRYAKAKDASIAFTTQNMLTMDDTKFHSIYCIGNTLVHLPSKQDIQAFLNTCFKKAEHCLLLQIINYDRVLDQHIIALPTIENEEVRFERKYAFKKDKVVFSSTLRAPQKQYHNSVELIPLRKQELEDMLQEAGFQNIQSFSGFQEEAFHENSYALVIVANKE
ncbi:MAG: class I SAM-dependent methyltransferase [Breznakia sp.]